MKLDRNEFVSQGSDPTMVVRWTLHVGKIWFVTTEFFGDVISNIGLESGERDGFLYTSVYIHPWLNKIATYLHNRWERKFQHILEEQIEKEYEDYYS